MNETAPRVIKIPAKPESVRQAELQRQLRVAAYCRVSTKEEDQANSYEAQKEYYTDKIMSNPVWTMAGVFADKGITGTSVKKREDFMRMIRHCRQRKIDVVLTKSVSRFARNTVDCLYYTRALKELGIAVIFASAALALILSDPRLMPIAEVRSFASALVFVGVAVGLALILPASFARGAFRKAHPFVGDFYTADQKSKARTALSTGLVAGIGLLMAGLAATIVLQADVWLASATFLAFAAVGVFVIVRSALLGARCNLARYNRASLGGMSEEQIEAMGDDGLAERARRAKRERGTYAAVMLAATAVGLVLMFTPASRLFLLAWPVGGLACLAIKAFRSARSDG